MAMYQPANLQFVVVRVAYMYYYYEYSLKNHTQERALESELTISHRRKPTIIFTSTVNASIAINEK